MEGEQRLRSVPGIDLPSDRKLSGRYQLAAHLGTRGLFDVFSALDTVTDGPVILKIMAVAADDLEFIVRFQTKGALVASLDHPNIWRIHAAFIDDGLACIVAEAFRGQALAGILREGPLPLDRVKILSLQILGALAYVHGRGIAHGDLHPENVVVGDGDRVKIRDIDERGMEVQRPDARARPAAGNSPYLAPERARGASLEDRADIYSFGAIAYHMLVGYPPASGTLVFEPHVIPEWQRMIAGALTANPIYRYKTAEALTEALLGLPPDVGTVVSEPQPQGKRCPVCGRRGGLQFCASCGTRLAGE